MRSGDSSTSRPLATADAIVHRFRAAASVHVSVNRYTSGATLANVNRPSASTRAGPPRGTLPADDAGARPKDSVWSSADVGLAPWKTTRPVTGTPAWSVSGTSRSSPLTLMSTEAESRGPGGGAPRPAPVLALTV